MGSKLKTKEVKPVEEFDVKDWEQAYNQLNIKHDKLKEKMRQALNHLSAAQQRLSEAVL